MGAGVGEAAGERVGGVRGVVLEPEGEGVEGWGGREGEGQGRRDGGAVDAVWMGKWGKRASDGPIFTTTTAHTHTQ